MTITELVFWYACIFLVLLVAMAVCLLRQKSGGKAPLPQLNWRAMVLRFKEALPRGEFWLKIFIAAFTAQAAGVIIVVFVLPYGTALMLGTLSVIGAALIFFVPKLLA